MTRRRSTLGAVVAVVVALLVWWAQSGDGTDTRADPASAGTGWVAAADLPPEAREMLVLIDRGGPFRHEEDGGTFGNFEGLLPDHERGYYREYTVDTPGSDDRGARRIVTGSAGEYYWTSDHYQSFERIRR